MTRRYYDGAIVASRATLISIHDRVDWVSEFWHPVRGLCAHCCADRQRPRPLFGCSDRSFCTCVYHRICNSTINIYLRLAVANGYSQVVQVDADGQHPVHQISDLVEAARNYRAHLVIGSRYLSADSTLIPSLLRRFSMWCLSKVASQLAGVRLTDTTSGFRLITEPLLSQFAETFPDYYLGDTFEATVAAARAGYRVVETPASLSPRQAGASSATSAQAIALIAKVLIIALTKLHYQLRSFEVES